MQQITSKGWDNINERSYGGLESASGSVHVTLDGSTQFGPNLEFSTQAPPNLSWSIEALLEGPYGRSNFINLFYCLPEIFAPVNEIASRVASANWQLKKFSNDEVDYKNETFNRLFTRPNPLMSFKKFVWQAVCYELLTGANFEYFNKPELAVNQNYDSILSWYNLNTANLEIDKKRGVDIYSATDLNDLVNGYKTLSNGRMRPLATGNVLPILDPDLINENDICAFKSDLCGAKLAIKNLIPVYEARGVIYVKRGAMGFFVSRKGDESGTIALTPKEKQEAQDEYQATYGLRADKNQVGVISAPIDYVQTSMSIAELQPFDETLADAVAIYKTLRVPRHLVPSKDNSTFSNAESDLKSFYDDVIIPAANRYAEAWTNYFKFERRYIYADFSHVAALQSNKKDKATTDRLNSTTWLERWKNGACTLNEWIASFDGAVVDNPLYNKKTPEMTPEELEILKNALNLSATTPNNFANENITSPENTNA